MHFPLVVYITNILCFSLVDDNRASLCQSEAGWKQTLLLQIPFQQTLPIYHLHLLILAHLLRMVFEIPQSRAPLLRTAPTSIKGRSPRVRQSIKPAQPTVQPLLFSRGFPVFPERSRRVRLVASRRFVHPKCFGPSNSSGLISIR